MLIDPQISDMSIVLIGSFNPAIVGPHWLCNQELISEQVRDNSEIAGITRNISRFSAADFQFEVTHSRFQLILANPPFVLLQDMALKLFGEHLPHTKIDGFGLNRTVHFSVGSEVERNRIGRILAPVEPWGEWANAWKDRKFPNSSGVVDLTMSETHPNDPHNRKTTAILQPSAEVKGNTGIFMTVNDNFECKGSDGKFVAPLIQSNFEPFIQRSEWIIDQIMKLRGKK